MSPLRFATAVQNVWFQSNSPKRAAFSLVEVMLVMTILSLIVLALMSVFSGTQRAFRASVTQSDVLEGGRDTMQLITADLRGMAASGGVSNWYSGPVNFCVLDNNYFSRYYNAPAAGYYEPLVQTLPGSTDVRSNLLQCFFVLGRRNNYWTGVGYFINASSIMTNSAGLYPLYRYSGEIPVQNDPGILWTNFTGVIQHDLTYNTWTNVSRVVDGVVSLTVRAYDGNGYHLMAPAQYNGIQWVTNTGILFTPPINDEVGCYFFSNQLPASVEVAMGVVEDRALQHAESLPTYTLRTNYLAGQSGAVHIFRQRVTIPNFDSSAYQ